MSPTFSCNRNRPHDSLNFVANFLSAAKVPLDPGKATIVRKATSGKRFIINDGAWVRPLTNDAEKNCRQNLQKDVFFAQAETLKPHT